MVKTMDVSVQEAASTEEAETSGLTTCPTILWLGLSFSSKFMGLKA